MMDRSTGSTDLFSPALKPNDEGSGIPKDTGDPSRRLETRKPVDVPKLFMFCHVFFIALCPGCLQRLNPLLDMGL
jgi:hypothetical protein